MPAQEIPLAAEFPDATRGDWRRLVAAVLARSGRPSGPDADPEDALTRTTYDGIAIKALYTAADTRGVDAGGLPGRPPFVRGATPAGAVASGWDVRVRHAGPDPDEVARAVVTDLENGATSVWLRLGPGALAPAQLPRALGGVYLDLAPVVLDAGADVVAAAEAFVAFARERGVGAGELRGSLGADPLGVRARDGGPLELDVLAATARAGSGFPRLRVATVDATVYHDAGASDAQELGIATAAGVEYLRALTGAGLPVDEAFAALEFRWAVTAEQFGSIAKLRAARRIWDRVAQLSGAGSSGRDGWRGQWQHATTSEAMLTRRDPWVNMLRTTVACFAAAVGGADAITVAPFDSAIGVSDDFARRIARNTQSVLHDESSLARVVDAGGGSWYVESLTDSLAGAAWDVFTGIERAGGAARALEDGVIGELVAATRERRERDIAHRRAPITGVSEFAFVGEQPVVRPAPSARAAGGVLPRVRWAHAFEELRDAADAAAVRPAVFLAGLGPLAEHSARTAFTVNLLAAGGIESVSADGDTDALVAAFRAARTQVACLCGSDDGYEREGAAAAAALRAAGATQVWLAGRADVAGVDRTLHAGCDAVAVLRDVLTATGAAA